MDSRSAEEPFLPLKELSARLDTEITNAANRLEGRGVRSPACAMKIFDRAATVEAQIQQIKCRLKIAVKEEEASIAALKECLKLVDRDNQETLEKLMPLGLKVPEDLLPVIKQMPMGAAPAESLSSSEEFVGNLNPLFKDEVVRSSQLRKPSQLPSHLSKPPQWPQSRNAFGQPPLRPLSGQSKLERYLAEMDDDNTVTMLKCKPTPVTGPAEEPALSSPTVKDVVQVFQPLSDQQEEPEQADVFPALARALTEETFTAGIEPLPATPAPMEKRLEKGDQLTAGKMPERKMPDLCATPTLQLPDFEEPFTVNFKVPEFGTLKPIVKTPELKESPAPAVLKKSNERPPW